MASIVVRREGAADAAGIREVNLAAFEGTAEAEIVDRIRESGGVQLSLVAVLDSALVGHILFTAVGIGDGSTSGMALAPMAVLPEHQNRGVGSALVRRGLETLRADGCSFVVVLGHPTYYPRFGFVPASRHGITCAYDGVPDEAFMVVELVAGALDRVSGVASYRPEFDGEP